MTISTCELFFRAIISLLNVAVFALFVATQIFLDQDNKFFFKWMLGNGTSIYISNQYAVSSSQSLWIKYLWYVVYTWQGLWMLFAVALLFKRKFPDAMNLWFFILFISSSALDIAWVVFMSKDVIIPALVAISCGVFLKASALVFVYVKFERVYDFEGHTLGEFWGFHILVFNGIAGYIVIVVYNTLIWLSIVLTYQEDFPERSSTTIALTIAYTLIIVWFILETTLFLWSTRFTFSIYPVLIISIVASLQKNWDPQSRNAILLAVLIAVACTFLVIHVLRVVFRLRRARQTFTSSAIPATMNNFNIEFMTTRF